MTVYTECTLKLLKIMASLYKINLKGFVLCLINDTFKFPGAETTKGIPKRLNLHACPTTHTILQYMT